jgi:hypothetical protein
MAIKCETVTLVATTVSLVTLDGRGRALRVTCQSASDDVFFRTDGVDPSVGGDESMVLLAQSARIVPVPLSGQIKLISSGTPDVTVELEG